MSRAGLPPIEDFLGEPGQVAKSDFLALDPNRPRIEAEHLVLVGTDQQGVRVAMAAIDGDEIHVDVCGTESGAYAFKFYPGDYVTMTKNDQIPFVYYGIDDDVNKPYYYKLNVSETETLSFASSIMDTLLPNSGYEFAYWTADAAVY